MNRNVVPRKPLASRLWWRLLLVGIVLLSFGLRLHDLGVFSFWTDEGLTPLRAGYSIPEILSNTVTIQAGNGKDTHPPLYYLLIHISHRVFGETDFAYRYPSVLAGILLVSIMYPFGRRLKSRWMGLLAAGLTAVNPLQIWYAREARMYTLLVLLAALTSYVLWQALTGTDLRRSLPLYLVLASLTVYIHYTAVFLIAAQSILWAWLLWRKGQRKLILGGALLLVLIAIPLAPVTIPRLFTGAEANYTYVPPLIILQDVVHGFGLGVTIDFKLLSTKLLDWGALGLLILGFVAARTWLQRSFLFFYLYAVVFGLMAGSLIKPMYQGVRHILIGSPAFLLLLAWGMLWLWQKTRQARRGTAVAWGSLAALGIIILTVGPAFSLNNLYTNPRYAKNDFQALIAYVEQHAGENDLLLFNDAILLPLYPHYQQRSDMAATALPTYPYPANERTIDELTTLAQTYQRIWFITSPPADDRDDDKLVQNWLTNNLTTIGTHSAWGRTVEVRVIGFDTRPQTITNLPENGRSHNIQWPSLPVLHGVQLQSSQPATLPTLWFDLYWAGGGQPDSDTQLRFTLRGPDDREWVIQNQRLAGTAVPWTAAPLIRQSYYLPIPVGTPPGDYTLYLEPPVSSDGPSLGDAQPLIDVELAVAESWPIMPDLALDTPALKFQNGPTLQGIAFPDDEVRPGHNLPFTLYWQADFPLPAADLRYEMELIAPDGSVVKTQSGQPGASWLATWPANTLIAEPTSLYFRPEVEPGRYQLRWRLSDGSSTIGGRPFWRPWSNEANILGEIEVNPWPLITTLPDNVRPIQVDFGPNIQLNGFVYEQTFDTLDVTLYWRAKVVPDVNYFSFVHLVAADGQIVTQQAFVPVGGLRPSRSWRAGEILTDAYTFTLSPDLPAGTYTLVAGLFDPDTGERPFVSQDSQPQEHNQFILGTISLP